MSFNSHYLTRDELLGLARKYADLPGTTLFYSGGVFESSQRSYLCLYPKKKIVAPDHDPWSLPISYSGRQYPEWVGYFSYEIGAFSDPEKRIPYSKSDLPFALFYQPSTVLEVDHRTGKATVHGDQNIDFQCVKQEAQKSPSLRMVQKGEEQSVYLDKVKKAQQLIREGEIYQVNLSQEFIYEGESDPFAVFESVVKINPAPFMVFMRLEDSALVSSSPERFLQKRGDMLETRPIKGTSKRGKTLEEDHRRKEELMTSPKEKAELLMITDLMRNDLGKVSLPGSVSTEKIWHLESYTNVHHMLSIIRSIAQKDLGPLDIVRSCFPGGSITGCPKLRAMEVIHQLEQRPRGIYTGSIGYFTGMGDFDFNIAIRTLFWEKDRISVQLGGAIVFDSIPEKEYEETLHKGESLFHSLN